MNEQLQALPREYNSFSKVSPPHMDPAMFRALLEFELPDMPTQRKNSDAQYAADSPAIEALEVALAVEPREPAVEPVAPDAEWTEEDDLFAGWEYLFAKEKPAARTVEEDDFEAWAGFVSSGSSPKLPLDETEAETSAAGGEGWLDELERNLPDADDFDGAPAETNAGLVAGEQEASELLERQFDTEAKSRKRRLGAAVLSLALVVAPAAGMLLDRGKNTLPGQTVNAQTFAVPRSPELSTSTTLAPVEATPATTIAPSPEVSVVSLEEIAKQLQAEQAEAARLAEEKAAADRGEAARLAAAEAAEASRPKVTSDKYEAMRQANIAEADMNDVDSIMTGESGWRADAVNEGGCIGVGQNCPDSRGFYWLKEACANWRQDLVCQLKRFQQYAFERYGSWRAARIFRDCVGSCYNPYTGGNTYKDHTWW